MEKDDFDGGNGGGVISGHLQRVKHVRVQNRRVRDARKRSKMEKVARNECKKKNILQSVYRNNKKCQKPYFITLLLFRNQGVLIRLFVSAVNNVLVRLLHNEF